MANVLPVKSYPDLFQERSFTINQGLDDTAAATVLGGGGASRTLYNLFTATKDTVIDSITIRADAVESSAAKNIAFFKADSGTVLSSGAQVTSRVAVTSHATVAPGKSVAAANTNKTLVPTDTVGAITDGSQVPLFPRPSGISDAAWNARLECILSTTDVSGTITRNRNLVKAGQTFGFVTFDGASATPLTALDGLTITVRSRETRA